MDAKQIKQLLIDCGLGPEPIPANGLMGPDCVGFAVNNDTAPFAIAASMAAYIDDTGDLPELLEKILEFKGEESTYTYYYFSGVIWK